MQEGGSCAAFSAYFLQNVNAYANANEQQLQQAVAAGPELTQACCRSLRQYVNAVRDPLGPLVYGLTHMGSAFGMHLKVGLSVPAPNQFSAPVSERIILEGLRCM